MSHVASIENRLSECLAPCDESCAQGNRSFVNKTDYQQFLDLLQETAELFNVNVAAICLMPTHYHLMVQTPDANLSGCMRHLNGVYTQKYNVLHGSDGTLFRGRYKSILVDADSYVLQLVRYIHRNPLKAGLVKGLDHYVWSSHKGYLSKARRPGQEQKRVNVDFPVWMIHSLDREAKRLGVPRQSIIKIWIAERLKEVSK